MRSTFGGLEMALRALMAQQAAIGVTNHNIGNVNTDGYSRQSADLVASDPFTVPSFERPALPGQMGTGVDVAAIQRFRDQFVGLQLRNANSTLSASELQQNTLRQIETIFNEPSSTGLNTLMSTFWNSWRDLSNDPQSLAQRQGLLENSITLANAFQQTRSQLTTLRQNLDQQVGLTVTNINNLAQQLASLNDQIVVVKANGDNPNDLLDRRGVLLDQLAKQVNISYVTEPNESLIVTISGHALVTGDQTETLTTQPDSSNQGLSKVVWQSDGSAVTATNGKLAGTITSRDSLTVNEITPLDSLASTLITQVNNVVEQGYALDNSTGPAVQFFTGTSARDIAVTSAVQGNLNLIAAAQSPNSPGDGSNALAVVNAQSALVMNGNTTDMGDFYNGVITQLGVTAQQANAQVSNQQALVKQLTQQQQQVSGVSIDEESANLVQFQQAYQAAARVMTTVDELLNTVINQMGLVGRG